MLNKIICICILVGYTYLVFIPTKPKTIVITQHTIISLIKNHNKETICLAKHIYFEGRGEPIKGQIAIGLVILNRLKHQSFPDTICKVVSEFSWTSNMFSNEPPNNKYWKNIQQLAHKFTKNNQINNIKDITKNSIYYHPTYISPTRRTKQLTYSVTIGNNKFYK